MKKTLVLVAAVMIAAIFGCSSHQVADATRSALKKYPAHSKKVFVTESRLPVSAKVELLAELKAGDVWYGKSDNLLESLADGARQLGGDAVVEARTWRQPSGFSWAAPFGSGKIVKVIDAGSVNFSELKGEWE
ncbi:MAG: hypothetical protein JXA20_17890 [Spirochaetes bacterium]|nr:hypothetical protein [Spirochaetota bacterium]